MREICFPAVQISVFHIYFYSIRKKQDKLVTLHGNLSKTKVYNCAVVKQNLQLSSLAWELLLEGNCDKLVALPIALRRKEACIKQECST